MTENSISIQLGREELVSLLNVMGLKGMLGLGEDYLANFAEEGQRQILRAGTNALRAKGWLREEVADGEVRLGVDGTILALVGMCVSAGRLLYISHGRRDALPRIWYVHLGEHMTVIHRTTRPGVHELWASVDKEEVRGEIAALLQLEEAAALVTGMKLAVSAAGMEQVVALARDGAEGETAVSDLLAQVEVAGEGREALVTAVQNMQANSMISLLEIQNGSASAPVRSFSLLQSGQDLWLMETAVDDASQLVLEQASAERVLIELAQLIGIDT